MGLMFGNVINYGKVGFGLILEPDRVINSITALGFHDNPNIGWAHNGFANSLVIWGLCILALCREKTWRRPLGRKISFVLGSYVCTMFWFKVHNLSYFSTISYSILVANGRVAKERWLHTSLSTPKCLHSGHGKLVRKSILATSRPFWANCVWICFSVGVLWCGFFISPSGFVKEKMGFLIQCFSGFGISFGTMYKFRVCKS